MSHLDFICVFQTLLASSGWKEAAVVNDPKFCFKKEKEKKAVEVCILNSNKSLLLSASSNLFNFFADVVQFTVRGYLCLFFMIPRYVQ